MMRRGSVAVAGGRIGAEPGIDPRRESAFLTYGHIHQQCNVEIADYSAVRSSFGRMNNQTFIKFLMDEHAGARESWVKVRWINVGGISWDIISALAIKYGAFRCRAVTLEGKLTTCGLIVEPRSPPSRPRGCSSLSQELAFEGGLLLQASLYTRTLPHAVLR